MKSKRMIDPWDGSVLFCQSKVIERETRLNVRNYFAGPSVDPGRRNEAGVVGPLLVGGLGRNRMAPEELPEPTWGRAKKVAWTPDPGLHFGTVTLARRSRNQTHPCRFYRRQ
jgi:hypothetical protein